MFSRLRRSSVPLHVTRPSHALGLALGLALSLWGSAGCSHFTKTKQCRALIAQVNPALDEVLILTDGGAHAAGGAAGAGGSGASTRYVSAAARYERLAKDLGPMEFASEQMAKSVAEYASVLSSTARALRALAAALDANNAGEIDRASRELERLDVREQSAVARIDAFCQAN